MAEPKYVKASAYARSKCLSLEETIKKCEANEIRGAFQKDGQWFVPMGAVFPTNSNNNVDVVDDNKEPTSIARSLVCALIANIAIFLVWIMPVYQHGKTSLNMYQLIFGGSSMPLNPALLIMFIFTFLVIIFSIAAIVADRSVKRLIGFIITISIYNFIASILITGSSSLSTEMLSVGFYFNIGVHILSLSCLFTALVSKD